MLNMMSWCPSTHQKLTNYKLGSDAIESCEDEGEDNCKKQKQSSNNETSQQYNNGMLSIEYYNQE